MNPENVIRSSLPRGLVSCWITSGGLRLSDVSGRRPGAAYQRPFGELPDGYVVRAGANTSYVPDCPALDLIGAMTVCAWARISAGMTYQTILLKGTSSTSWSSNNYVLGFYYEKPRFVLGSKGTVTADNAVSSGWHLIAATAALGTTDAIKLYVDGVLVKTGSRSGNPTANTQALYIGGHPAYGESWIWGDLAMPAIFNRALSGSEIKNLFIATRGMFDSKQRTW